MVLVYLIILVSVLLPDKITVFSYSTWSNAGAILGHIFKFDVAPIQGQPLFKDGVITLAPSMQILINISIELKSK